MITVSGGTVFSKGKTIFGHPRFPIENLTSLSPNDQLKLMHKDETVSGQKMSNKEMEEYKYGDKLEKNKQYLCRKEGEEEIIRLVSEAVKIFGENFRHLHYHQTAVQTGNAQDLKQEDRTFISSKQKKI